MTAAIKAAAVFMFFLLLSFKIFTIKNMKKETPIPISHLAQKLIIDCDSIIFCQIGDTDRYEKKNTTDQK